MAMIECGLFRGCPYHTKSIPAVRDSRKRVHGILCLQTGTAPSRTQRIMENITVSGEVGGAGGVYSYDALKRLDRLWSNICSVQTAVKKEEMPTVVTVVPDLLGNTEISGKSVDKYDVMVCGGTLGIFIATALRCRGLRVGVVERNVLKGREQEWNISRKELLELVKVGVLEETDIDKAIATEFNPNRCGFEGRGDIWVEGILNLGVSPVKLIEAVKRRFISLGGVIFEDCSVSRLCVYDDAAVLHTTDGNIYESCLIIDAMGNFSPIVKQIRQGSRPDGVCLVVGSCARGFDDNTTSDVIYSSRSVKQIGGSKVHLFWEAFPSGSGPNDRTTYMFTYVNPKRGSPTLEELLEEYWNLMPQYQVLHTGGFARQLGGTAGHLWNLPYISGQGQTNSPLPAHFDRILQFGDASGIQSPVSFGGFGSLTRHLGRLSDGIYEAVTGNFLDSGSLSLLNPYMPNLSSSWLFQKAMSAKQQSDVSADFINELLYANFRSMQQLGDPVLRPFLQDVVQFWPLLRTLGLVMVTKPLIIPSIFRQVGYPVLLDWFGHFFLLGCYTFFSTFVDPTIRPLVNTLPDNMKYKWNRCLEAWRYGSGLDYEL